MKRKWLLISLFSLISITIIFLVIWQQTSLPVFNPIPYQNGEMPPRFGPVPSQTLQYSPSIFITRQHTIATTATDGRLVNRKDYILYIKGDGAVRYFGPEPTVPKMGQLNERQLSQFVEFLSNGFFAVEQNAFIPCGYEQRPGINENYQFSFESSDGQTITDPYGKTFGRHAFTVTNFDRENVCAGHFYIEALNEEFEKILASLHPASAPNHRYLTEDKYCEQDSDCHVLESRCSVKTLINRYRENEFQQMQLKKQRSMLGGCPSLSSEDRRLQSARPACRQNKCVFE